MCVMCVRCVRGGITKGSGDSRRAHVSRITSYHISLSNPYPLSFFPFFPFLPFFPAVALPPFTMCIIQEGGSCELGGAMAAIEGVSEVSSPFLRPPMCDCVLRKATAAAKAAAKAAEKASERAGSSAGSSK